MTELGKAEELFSRLQRQFPRWPSTFSTCPRCGKHFARGSDVCAVCLTDDLTELVGKELANETHAAMNNVATTWNRIRKKLEGIG